MGICNREQGECECAAAFEGAACELLSCPGDIVCSGHGACLSISLLAAHSRTGGALNEFTYGATPNSALRWDWDGVHGCACDDGWTNHDDSGDHCPYDDDPLSTQQNNEIQATNCDLSDDTDASVTFTFRDDVTAKLDPTT